MTLVLWLADSDSGLPVTPVEEEHMRPFHRCGALVHPDQLGVGVQEVGALCACSPVPRQQAGAAEDAHQAHAQEYAA